MSMKKSVRSCVNSFKPYVPGKPIEELRRELKLKKISKLASNENSIGPSTRALAAVKKALGNINRYPDGNCFYLKQVLAKKNKLQPENIIVGNGSDELIVLALRAFINKSDEVIIANPTFLVYKLAAVLAEAKVITVDLKAYRYDLPAMKSKITSRTKVIFIANPDNPTGSYVDRMEVEQFLRGIPKHILIFFDEAYFEYVGAKDYPDTLKYLRRGNVIVSRTFSKAYGLAGLRVGWAAASREIIGYLNQVREPFNVNILAQTAAIAALEDKKHIQKTLKLIKSGKKFIVQELKKIGLFYVPSAANFILINIGPKAKTVYEKLLKKGIIVREMSGWGLNNFIRVTIGTQSENKAFILELKKNLLLIKEEKGENR